MTDYEHVQAVIERVMDAKAYTEFREEVEGLTADDLQDEEYLEELVAENNAYDEPVTIEDRWEELQQDVSLEVRDEAYWLVPVLGEVFDRHDPGTPYEDIRDDIEPIAGLLFEPQGHEQRDVPLDDLERKNYRYTSRDVGKKDRLKGEDLYHNLNLEKQDTVSFSDARYHGENLFRNAQNIGIYSSFMTGENLLRNAKQVEAVESILEGKNLLRTSEDVDIKNCSLYGDETLKRVISYRIMDSTVIGEAPFSRETGSPTDALIMNSIVFGDRPLAENENAHVRDSIIVAREMPYKRVNMQNSFIVTPRNIHYYRDSQVSGYEQGPHTTVEREDMETFRDLVKELEV